MISSASPGWSGSREQRAHGGVDMGAIAGDLRDARPGQETPLRSGVAGAHGLVVRVEDVGVRVVERAVAAVVLPEHERLEEPRHVGPVPLRRADVGHGLHRLVLGAEDAGQPLGGGPDTGVCPGEVGRCRLTDLLHGSRPFATAPGAAAHGLRDCGHPTQMCSAAGAFRAIFCPVGRIPGGSAGDIATVPGAGRRCGPRAARPLRRAPCGGSCASPGPRRGR